MMTARIPDYCIVESFKEPIIRIDFDPDAAWRLVVIDDRIMRVQHMCETIIRKTGNIAALMNYNSVVSQFDHMKASAETFELSLLLLPWMVRDVSRFGSICFAPFPSSSGHIREILEMARTRREGRTATEHLAFLIDERDTRDNVRERFTETFEMLAHAGHPVRLVSRFTRGADELGDKVKNVRVIIKQSFLQDYTDVKQSVHAWLNLLKGQISGDLFQCLTGETDTCCIDDAENYACHHASQISSCPARCRRCIANKLKASDGYGVWSWVLEVLTDNPLPPEAPNRWLAAKAFQTTDPDSTSVPITALIGICEGAEFLSPELKGNYAVISSLADVPKGEIDDLPILGTILLAKGRYEDFASAIRDWIIYGQQFEKETYGRVKSVRISSHDKTTSVRLEYSAAIDGIFTSKRRGGTVRAWEKLEPFARTVNHDGAMVELVFDSTR